MWKPFAGCLCLTQDDSTHVSLVIAGSIAEDQLYANIRQKITDQAMLICFAAASQQGLINPNCTEVIHECRPIGVTENTCPIDADQDSAWGGSAGDDGDFCDEGGGGVDDTGEGGGVDTTDGEVHNTCRGVLTAPAWPSNVPSAAKCTPAGSDSCQIDRYFVQALNTSPLLIYNSTAGAATIVTSPVAGVKITSANTGSLAKALGFQVNDVITKVEGIAVTSRQRIHDAYLRVMAESLKTSITVNYRRGTTNRTKVVEVTDLPGYT